MNDDPLLSVFDDVTAQLAAARERVARIAWETTRPNMRHRLVEIIDPHRPITVGLDPAGPLDRNDFALVVESDPPCYACSLDDRVVHVEPPCDGEHG